MTLLTFAMIKFTTQIWRQLPSFLHQTEISESIKLRQLGFRYTMFHTDLENRSEIMETENKAKRKLSESSGKENSSNEKKNVVLQFAKLSEHAFAPVRGSAYAAGYDLFRFFLFNFFKIICFVNFGCNVIVTVMAHSLRGSSKFLFFYFAALTFSVALTAIHQVTRLNIHIIALQKIDSEL